MPGKGVGGVGDNVHDALLSLFAEMESSELCRHLGVRFAGVGGAKIKNVLPRSTDGLVATASSGTPRAVRGTPSHTSREASLTLASASSNVPPLASPAVEPRKTQLTAQRNSPARPSSHTPISAKTSPPAHMVCTNTEYILPSAPTSFLLTRRACRSRLQQKLRQLDLATNKPLDKVATFIRHALMLFAERCPRLCQPVGKSHHAQCLRTMHCWRRSGYAVR